MKKKTKKKSLKIVIIIVIILAVLVTAAVVGVSFYLGKINRNTEVESVNPEDETYETDEDAQGTTLDPEDVAWAGDESVLKDKDIINILLIGQDARPGETRARSDSMILVTINKNDNSIKMTSFMRDLYVQIPGYSDNRINASYAFGGMDLLDKTIAKNFLVSIDGNIEVNFTEFVKIIDKIGGIDVTINQDEANYLKLSGAGTVHMNGTTALAYSRIRYVGHGDYERTSRQRTVLLAAYNKTKTLGITKILGLVNELLPSVTTDLSNTQLIGLATTILQIDDQEIDSYRIPIDGAYNSSVIRGMQVLVPDLEKNRAELRKNLYNIN